MKIGLVQISDIHLREASSPIDKRVDALAAAAWSECQGTTRQYLLITGDVAFSGKAAEYRRAETLVRAILDQRPRYVANSSVEVLVVPGNHDCDFSETTDLRGELLDVSATSLAAKGKDSAVLGQLATPHSNFFDFARRVSPAVDWGAGPKSLAILLDEVGDATVQFVLLNSALASRLAEQQGDLFLLEADLNAIEELPAAQLRIALLHHPLNWLDANNAVRASAALDSQCDLVFSGHQHAEESYLKEHLQGSVATFFEAGVLESTDSDDSALRVVVVDLANATFRERTLHWRGDAYLPHPTDSEWRSLRLNPAPRREHFTFSPTFERALDDPGTGFSHPRKEALLLADFFVPPELSTRNLRSSSALLATTRIESEGSLEYLLSRHRLLVTGEERSGKSALSRVLARLHRVQGRVPLLFPGEKLRTLSATDMQRSLRPSIEEQYGHDAVLRYFQLPVEHRCLIVDDFQRCGLNKAGQEALLNALGEAFGTVVVFADALFRFEELRPEGYAVIGFADYEHAEIREMGFRLRGKLIEKWLSLGRERLVDERDLAIEVAKGERLVEALLGKNLLPSFPFIVLTILQLAEAGREAGRDAGSFGSMYEALISSAIAEGSSAADADLNYGFLAALAREMYEADRRRLSDAEVRQVALQYEREFAVDIRVEQRLASLEQRRLLRRIDGHWECRYPYIYYYFLARWFRAHPGARSQLLEMADHVYSDQNTNVLVFYLSLTQDFSVVERVLENAGEIYGKLPPCDFESDVAFVNELFRGQLPAAPLIGSGDPAEREKHRAQLDEEGAEAAEGQESHTLDVNNVVYDESLDDVIKLNIAFKTLQILGQFVRSFPGSVDALLKERIVGECFRLGLRSLTAVLRGVGLGVTELRHFFAELVRDRRTILTDAEAKRAGDQAVIWLVRRCSFGVVKKVSNAVGLEELAQTFDAVIRGLETPATELLDISIKLDHFRNVPEAEIREAGKDLRTNYLASVVLRDLVQHHLLLFPVPIRQRQRLQAWLELEGQQPQFVDNPRRRLRGGG